jgi:hypothetical protein
MQLFFGIPHRTIGLPGAKPPGSCQITFAASFWFSCISLLVMCDGAFYNPSNTATEAVVPFTCHPVLNRPKHSCPIGEGVLEY